MPLPLIPILLGTGVVVLVAQGQHEKSTTNIKLSSSGGTATPSTQSTGGMNGGATNPSHSDATPVAGGAAPSGGAGASSSGGSTGGSTGGGEVPPPSPSPSISGGPGDSIIGVKGGPIDGSAGYSSGSLTPTTAGELTNLTSSTPEYLGGNTKNSGIIQDAIDRLYEQQNAGGTPTKQQADAYKLVSSSFGGIW